MRAPLAANCAFVVAATWSGAALAQSGAVSRSSPPEVSSTGDVGPGVYRREVHGTVPVEFLLHGRGSEPIGVAGEDTDNDPATVTFTPACATPCTLWFNPGPFLVQLGRSSLRERVFQVAVDVRPVRVSFSRDSFGLAAAGVGLAGLGLVGLLMGIPAAIDEPGRGALWWSVTGAGAVLMAGGAVLTYLALGSAESHEMR